MPKMHTIAALLLGGLLSSGTAQAQQAHFFASFFDISDALFRVKAVASPDVVNEYLVCKAVWFAERKGRFRIALGSPSQGTAEAPPGFPAALPADWVAVTVTVHLDPLPADAFRVSVPDTASECRQAWDWYR